MVNLRQNFSLLSIFLYCSLYAEASINITAYSAKLLPSVVKIKVQHGDAPTQDSELIQSDTGGTGFVFDTNHHILTNAHVIKDAKKIAIVDFNNTEYPAVLVAKDDKADIAILNAATFSAPLIPFCNSAQVAMGDNVFVIGSPYSLGLGVTAGIVNAVQRYLPNYPYQYFIQTDAAINPGNSGGPVFNQNGELIAVATMTFAKSGGYTNIGFAIPINEAIRSANLLVSQKKIDRGYLGANLLISDKMSRKMGYQSSVLITHVNPVGPAQIAGLKAGDLITQINDEKFIDNGSLHRYLEHSKPGDILKLAYIRNKRYAITTLSLGTTPNTSNTTTNIATADPAEKLGLILEDGNGDDGIKILLSYGSAKTSGLEAGDTILQINTITLKTIKDLNTHLSNLKDNEIAMILIRRNGDLITLPLGSKTALQGYSTAN
jgi:serine protease Do